MTQFRAVDLFCGAGGTTTGAEQSGHIRVDLAVNHWDRAIDTHQLNHPSTEHVQDDLANLDPEDYKGYALDVIFASPECTHHSNARGGKPMEDQKRIGGWQVLNWVASHRPRWLVLENVKEWVSWGPLTKKGKPNKRKKGHFFQKWLSDLRSLGYSVEYRLLNAADYGEATRRVRLFVIARRGVNKPIPWPDPERTEDNWRPASDIIDWSKPMSSIFGRKRPLAENTLKRIAAGLEKFCGVEDVTPFLVHFRRNCDGRSLDLPLPTITAGGTHFGIAAPFVLDVNHGTDASSPHNSRLRPLSRPLNTVTASNGQALCVPFYIEYYGTALAQSIEEPLTTVTTKERHALVVPELREAMDRYQIGDIHFRMLDVDELAAAQGFPPDYQFVGNKKERTRMIGNAVPPGFARAISNAIAN